MLWQSFETNPFDIRSKITNLVLEQHIPAVNDLTLQWRHNGRHGSQITSHGSQITIVYSTVYSGGDQRKHQISASLAFVWGIHRWPVNSPHKWPVTRKRFPFDDVSMSLLRDWNIPCLPVLSKERMSLPHDSPILLCDHPLSSTGYPGSIPLSILSQWTPVLSNKSHLPTATSGRYARYVPAVLRQLPGGFVKKTAAQCQRHQIYNKRHPSGEDHWGIWLCPWCRKQSSSRVCKDLGRPGNWRKCPPRTWTHRVGTKMSKIYHDDVIQWNHFPRYWPFVRGIHRLPVNYLTKTSDAELWCFLWLRLNKRLSKPRRWWFKTPSRSLWHHRIALSHNITVHKGKQFC